MRNRFDEQLALLSSSLITMGGCVEHAIQLTVKALVEQDAALAREAIEYDDEIDAQEKEIQSLCMKLLLQQQPIARDLRQISAALKIIDDMERIGDHGTDISEITLLLSDKRFIDRLVHIPQMAAETIFMLKTAIDAFVTKDLALARKVIGHDDVVDELYVVVRSELISLIRKNIDNCEQAFDLMMAAKYFERIGDRAVSIADWVVFSLTGERKHGRII